VKTETYNIQTIVDFITAIDFLANLLYGCATNPQKVEMGLKTSTSKSHSWERRRLQTLLT